MNYAILATLFFYAVGLVDCFSGDSLGKIKKVFEDHALSGTRKFVHLLLMLTMAAPIHIINGVLISFEFLLKSPKDSPK